MKIFALSCLKTSLVFLKANLAIILIFQILKYSTRSTNSDTNSIENHQERPHRNALVKQFSDFLLPRLTWIYTLNSDLIDITKIDLIQFMKNTTDHDKPIVKLKTFVNASEIIEFNLIKNIIKIGLFFNINLVTILINIFLISYLIVNDKKHKNHILFHIQLCINLFLFLLIVPFNLINMKNICSQLGIGAVFSSLNSKVWNFVEKIFLANKISLESLSLNSNDYIFVELDSNLKLNEKNIPSKNLEHLALSNFYLNLFFMIFSISSLGLYSYLIKENHEFEQNTKKDIESQPFDTFWQLKSKKLEKKSTNSLKTIIQFIFIIFFLSIWDIVDVLQFFKINSWEKTNLNFFNPQLSNYNDFLTSLNQSRLTMKKISEPLETTSNYLNRYDDNFYKHYFSHSEVRYDFVDKNYKKNHKIVTTIKGIFVVKMHSHFFFDLVVVFLTFGCLYQFLYIDKYLQWLDDKKNCSTDRNYFV